MEIVYRVKLPAIRIFQTDKDILDVNSEIIFSFLKSTLRTNVGTHHLTKIRLAKFKTFVTMKRKFLEDEIENKNVLELSLEKVARLKQPELEYRALHLTETYLNKLEQNIVSIKFIEQ